MNVYFFFWGGDEELIEKNSIQYTRYMKLNIGINLFCFRRGWQLPCGLTSKQQHIQNRTLPNRPEYNYKYCTSVDKQIPHDSLGQRDRTFVDPQTGAVYEGYTGSRAVVFSGADGDLGSYKTNAPLATCTHVYECPDFETGTMPPHQGTRTGEQNTDGR